MSYDDDLNNYMPSILRPRTIRKNKLGNLSLTQNSTVSHHSLSLKRNNNLSTVNINESLIRSRNAVSLKPKNTCCSTVTNILPKVDCPHKDIINNIQDSETIILEDKIYTVGLKDKENTAFTQNIIPVVHKNSLQISDVVDIDKNDIESVISLLSFNNLYTKDFDTHKEIDINRSVFRASTHKDICRTLSNDSEETINCEEKPVISVTFCIKDYKKVDISTNNSNIKKVGVEHDEGKLNIECELVEESQLSEVSEIENILNMDELPKSIEKRKTAAINLDIKKRKLSKAEQSTETDKVLILKTNAIEDITHVIVQPPNYKIVKRKTLDKSKGKRKSLNRSENNALSPTGNNIKQKFITSYFKCTNVLKTKRLSNESSVELLNGECYNVRKVKDLVHDDLWEMNKSQGAVVDGRTFCKPNRNGSSRTPRPSQGSASPRASLKASMSDVPRNISPKSKRDSAGSFSSRRNVDTLQFNIPLKSKAIKNAVAARDIPHYKIVAGTHFAVDAFSYGDIPHVKHYFLTHFHSDHYTGLKKSFNKSLLCSKITADLCTSRLGVNSKYIQVINVDETIRIEGVDISVIDANHCPGAVMLVFSLPGGKSLLHTGDFRASPAMESVPVFWNKDIHTIYLDTTYCNPRYDFPTQDQSLEMALYILRQKKMALEKAGKKFSSVLIVCGTYTIGKEKFFLGMARRVGCSVWACPEKERVLRTVEGHGLSSLAPHACQLHVVPMRDLTHEKLRSYLDSMQGCFSEVVAFKPSGWENGNNSSIEMNSVTIHGIPYSEHSSFSELVRFVKFLKPKQVVPTVDIPGGIKAVQKYFPCPLAGKDYMVQCQSKLTDFFGLQHRQQTSAVT